MLHNKRFTQPRGSPQHHHADASLLTSTSAPLSSPHDTTSATTPTTTSRLTPSNHRHRLHHPQQHSSEDPEEGGQLNSTPFHPQREAHLRAVLHHPPPSSADVSAVASAAYVQALMALIDQHSADVEQMVARIDGLQARRETYHADLAREAAQREAQVQELRNACADATLQVQEERERSTRLMHETTVLHTQQAAAREQLGRLVELCRARGKRLRAFYHHFKNHNSSSSANPGHKSSKNSFALEDDGNFYDGEERSAVQPLGSSPSQKLSAAASLTMSPALPASLSLHRAAGTRAAQGLQSGFSGSANGVDDVHNLGDDAELAAILNLPYKTLQPHTPSPTASPLAVTTPPTTTASAAALASSPSSPPAAHVAFGVVTANTATTAQLLALHAEVNMLRQQLEEQRGAYEGERGARTRADNDEHRRAQEQINRYAATVQQLEALHEESLRELVQYRHCTARQLRDLRGEVEWLKAALQHALELAEQDRRRQHNEVYATEQRMSKQYYPKVQSLHSELAEYRRASAAQAREHAQELAEKEAQISELQQKLKAEVSQRRRVEERYKLEMAGVHSELDLMRQSLRQMERRVYYRNVREEAAAAEEEVTLESFYH